MKPKKNKKVDVDHLRGLFFRTGLIIATGLTILAFQWRSGSKTTTDPDSNLVINEDEEIADITIQKPEPKPIVHFELQIVPNTDPVEDTSNAFNVDLDQDDSIFTPPNILPTETETFDDSEPFIIVQQYPEFRGGEAARQKFLSDNLVYPEMERDNGIEGPVVVNFIVEKDGSLTHLNILHGVTPNINNEAIRVIKKMPKWNPGQQRKKPVRVSVNMLIRFELSH